MGIATARAPVPSPYETSVGSIARLLKDRQFTSPSSQEDLVTALLKDFGIPDDKREAVSRIVGNLADSNNASDAAAHSNAGAIFRQLVEARLITDSALLKRE